MNNIHEKTLHKVVTKEYMLSAGKLFDIIKKLRKGKLEGKYEQAFASYLDKL